MIQEGGVNKVVGIRNKGNECVRSANPPPKQCYEYIYDFSGSRCNHCGVSRRNHVFYVYSQCRHAVCEKCYKENKYLCPEELGYGSEIDDVVRGKYEVA